MKALFALLALLCLVLANTAAAAGGVGEKGLDPVADRPPAPEFELPGSNGELIRLADYRGKVLILNFWATWCPPCRAEMPAMQRTWERVRAEGIELAAINVGEDAATVRRFAEEYGIGFPLLMDEESKVVRAWPVVGLPTTFVVDPHGGLAYKAAGERDWEDEALLDLVRALR